MLCANRKSWALTSFENRTGRILRFTHSSTHPLILRHKNTSVSSAQKFLQVNVLCFRFRAQKLILFLILTVDSFLIFHSLRRSVPEKLPRSALRSSALERKTAAKVLVSGRTRQMSGGRVCLLPACWKWTGRSAPP